MPTNDEGRGAAPAPLHEVERPRMSDALYQPFKNEPTRMGMDPSDGLPRPIVSNPMKDAQAPELDPVRFVCMADCSSFVLRDSWGAAVVRLERAEVNRAPDGRWRADADVVTPKLEALSSVARSSLAGRLTDGYYLVEPIRPQCVHYARQLIPFPEENERTLAIRLCTARRTDEGEFLDLGNQQVLACELRVPSYGNEAAQIDAFDERTLDAQRATKAEIVADDFDLDAALGGQKTN
jgi:hypothetical protein